jgi:hypothetical protein
MTAQDKGEVDLTPVDGAVAQREQLPYRIELWGAGDRGSPERVLARAFSATLARAIFKAAQGEHPDRRITLSRGSRIIAESQP